MRRAFSGLAVLALALAVLVGPEASAQKKKGTVEKDLDDKNSEKTIKAGVLVGKVMNIYEGSRKIRLQVSVPTTKFNSGAMNEIAQAQLSMAQARARRDLLGMRQAQMQLMRAQGNLYQVELKNVDVEIEARDDVVVRTARPKADFDDKGRVKKLTKAELKALKGPDPKAPGYKAEFGDVAVDQLIQVKLVRKKPEAGAKPKVVAKPKPKLKGKGKKAKDDDIGDIGAADLLGENGPQISMIIILGEVGPGR